MSRRIPLAAVFFLGVLAVFAHPLFTEGHVAHPGDFIQGRAPFSVGAKPPHEITMRNSPTSFGLGLLLATAAALVEVRPERRIALGMRWLVLYSRERGEKTMIEKLGNELLDAANNRGNAVKKKEDVHRMAEANKAFAHYRW